MGDSGNQESYYPNEQQQQGHADNENLRYSQFSDGHGAAEHKPLGVSNGNSNNSSGTFANESEQMKIFVTNPNVTYHTRHARRIYVGGIPPNYSDEEELRNFFNKVIAKGLSVENDHSYVISVYMNQKKCYAFVEFNSIDLTTACLDMDGIIFKKVTLKIYRANEYRPELVPPSKLIKLDLSGWSFGLATGAGANGAHGNSNPSSANSSGTNFVPRQSSWSAEESAPPQQQQQQGFGPDHIASLIQFTNIASMQPGSLVIVGFPYETAQSCNKAGVSPTRTALRGVGTGAAPACLRKCLTAYPYGAICNAELGVDLSLLPIMDVGDVLAGQSPGETKALLSTTVSELLMRGSVPFLVGGSRDQTFNTAMGLVAASGVCVGVMNVSAQVDCKILDCPEFCAPSSLHAPTPVVNSRASMSPNRSQNCYGRYVQFGAQGSQCNNDVAKSIGDRGGHIFWLHKDLRSATTESIAIAQFNRALRNLDACVLHDQQRKGVNTAALRASYPQSYMMVSVDCGVLAGSFNPLAGSCHSSCGLTVEEVLEIAFVAGAHPNVALFELTEFRPDVEANSRLNSFLADVFYKFALGVATRTQQILGGALGAGASALAGGAVVPGTASPVLIPAASVPYGRAAGVNAAGVTKRPLMPGAAVYVPDNVGSRYQPSKDPAVILQQQQHQQQILYQQQQAALGRGPYTSQQLQVQQQQQIQMQQSLSRPGTAGSGSASSHQNTLHRAATASAFPIMSEGALNKHNGSSKFLQGTRSGNGNSSYFSSRCGDEDNLSIASSADYNSVHFIQHQAQHQQQQPQPSRQLPIFLNQSHGAQGSYNDDDASSFGGSVISRSSILNKPGHINTTQAQAHAQPQSQASSFLSGNPGIGASVEQGVFQSQQRQLVPPISVLHSAFPSDHKWNSLQSASLTPTSVSSQTTNPAPFLYPQSDWASAHNNESRLSMLSMGSTGSLPLHSLNQQNHGQNQGHQRQNQNEHSHSAVAQQSFGNELHSQQQQEHFNHASSLFSDYSNNTGSSSSSHLGEQDFSSPYDDPMDKLIGVTNIGHIPSFDDPRDPSYLDD